MGPGEREDRRGLAVASRVPVPMAAQRESGGRTESDEARRSWGLLRRDRDSGAPGCRASLAPTTAARENTHSCENRRGGPESRRQAPTRPPLRARSPPCPFGQRTRPGAYPLRPRAPRPSCPFGHGAHHRPVPSATDPGRPRCPFGQVITPTRLPLRTVKPPVPSDRGPRPHPATSASARGGSGPSRSRWIARAPAASPAIVV